jgi:hypothetical protein
MRIRQTARKSMTISDIPFSHKPQEIPISKRSPDKNEKSKRKLFKLQRKKQKKNIEKKCINNQSSKESTKNSYVIETGCEATDENDNHREMVKDAKYLLGNLERDIPIKILTEYENEKYGIPKSYLIEWRKNETFTPIPSFVEAKEYMKRMNGN